MYLPKQTPHVKDESLMIAFTFLIRLPCLQVQFWYVILLIKHEHR